MGRRQESITLFSSLCVSLAMRQITGILRPAAGPISRPESGLPWLSIRVTRMSCFPRLPFRRGTRHGLEEYLGRNRCERGLKCLRNGCKSLRGTSKVRATEITRSKMIGRKDTLLHATNSPSHPRALKNTRFKVIRLIRRFRSLLFCHSVRNYTCKVTQP